MLGIAVGQPGGERRLIRLSIFTFSPSFVLPRQLFGFGLARDLRAVLGRFTGDPDPWDVDSEDSPSRSGFVGGISYTEGEL